MMQPDLANIRLGACFTLMNIIGNLVSYSDSKVF